MTIRAEEGAHREVWCTPLLFGCRVQYVLVLFKKKFASIAALFGVITITGSTHAELLTGQPIPVVGKVNPEKIIEIDIEDEKKTWKCPTCTKSEQYVLAQLQERTLINDKNSIATILGNIKQESNFVANVCEGGARVPYNKCLRGGYGLIQWTSTGRYNGLGRFAKRYGCNPSTLACQTRYMINEPQFQKVLPEFEGHGWPIHQYMVPAYYWLGWGIKGHREQYAHQYHRKLVWQ